MRNKGGGEGKREREKTRRGEKKKRDYRSSRKNRPVVILFRIKRDREGGEEIEDDKSNPIDSR